MDFFFRISWSNCDTLYLVNSNLTYLPCSLLTIMLIFTCSWHIMTDKLTHEPFQKRWWELTVVHEQYDCFNLDFFHSFFYENYVPIEYTSDKISTNLVVHRFAYMLHKLELFHSHLGVIQLFYDN